VGTAQGLADFGAETGGRVALTGTASLDQLRILTPALKRD
jgi:hypothetical protein